MQKYDIRYVLVLVIVLFGCRPEPEKNRPPDPVKTAGDVAAVTTTLATIGPDDRPQSPLPVVGHPAAPATFQIYFSQTGKSVAYIAKAGDKVRIVHNGKAGKLYETIGEVAFSPDGTRLAYGALQRGAWRMVVDDGVGSGYDALGRPLFSPDSRHIAYAALKGDQWFLIVDGNKSAGARSSFAGYEFSADATKIACVESPDNASLGRLTISDLEFKTQTVIEPAGRVLVTNSDRTRIATVVQEKGKEAVLEVSFADPRTDNKGLFYDAIGAVNLGPDGASLAYEAERAGEHLLVFNGKEERIPKKTLASRPVIRPDLKAVGAVVADADPSTTHGVAGAARGFARIHQFFVRSAGRVKEYDEATDFIYNLDGSAYAFIARIGDRWFANVNGLEGPAFDRVVSPVFSPDGQKLVYRARKAGKRFVVVADLQGRILQQHAGYEQVFQPVFTADGKSVAYGVKDGNNLIWKVERM